MNNTMQRSAIMAELSNSHDHPTADELYSKLRKKIPQLSLGTVYRNLDQLSQLGWIRCINGRQKRFDGMLNPHYHMHCNCCGRVMDVEIDDTLSELNRRAGDVVKLLGYDSVDLMFHGVCSNCKREKSK